MKLLKYLLITLAMVSLFCCGKDDDNGSEGENPTVENGFIIGDEVITSFEAIAYKSTNGILIKIDFNTEDELYIICADVAEQAYTFTTDLSFDTQTEAFAISTNNFLSSSSSAGTISLLSVGESLDIEFDIDFGLLTSLKDGKISNIKIEEQSFIDFSQISPVDANGAVLGLGDETDWQVRESWNHLEKILFPSFPFLSVNLTDTIELLPGYPNPCLDVFSFSFMSNRAVQKIHYVFVNDNFEVLHQGIIESDSFDVGFNTVNYNLEATTALTSIPAGQYFRQYYIIETENSQLIGHGDLLKNE